MTKQILALGGAPTGEHAINRYIVGMAHKDKPSVCLIMTASGEASDYIDGAVSAFAGLGCSARPLGLFRPPTADLRSFVFEHNIVYVGGGNTKSMLALWREWGLDVILREAWESGIVLCGPSAGSICWFEFGTTDSIPGSITALKCLGLLPGSNCPHYDSEEQRRPAYHAMLMNGLLPAGYATEDCVGLHYVDRELASVVTSRQGAHAYRVEVVDGQVRETIIEPTLIS